MSLPQVKVKRNGDVILDGQKIGHCVRMNDARTGKLINFLWCHGPSDKGGARKTRKAALNALLLKHEEHATQPSEELS